jgi:hypothetical protein
VSGYRKYSKSEERRLEKHKIECYHRWRTQELQKAQIWLSRTQGKDWDKRYDELVRTYGKRFAKDVLAAKANQDSRAVLER